MPLARRAEVRAVAVAGIGNVVDAAAGVSMMKAAHSALLRSSRWRAAQWRIGASVTATPGPSSTRSPQSWASARIDGSWSRMIVSFPSGVTTRHRCAAASATISQHRDDRNGNATPDCIDRRQRIERDARIVHPSRSDEGKRRGALRPERVGQNVHARRLQQKRRMADERDTPLGACNPCGRPVGIKARCPCRPFGPVAADVPAQQRCSAIGRRAVRIEKPQAVEVIRHRAVVVALPRGAKAETASPAAVAAARAANMRRRVIFMCGAPKSSLPRSSRARSTTMTARGVAWSRARQPAPAAFALGDGDLARAL